MCSVTIVLVPHRPVDHRLTLRPARVQNTRRVSDNAFFRQRTTAVSLKVFLLTPSPTALSSRASPRWHYPGPCCPSTLIGPFELSSSSLIGAAAHVVVHRASQYRDSSTSAVHSMLHNWRGCLRETRRKNVRPHRRRWSGWQPYQQ